jgi:hypothetical protein
LAEVVRRPFEPRLELAGFLREAALLRADACGRDREVLLAVEARLRGFVFAPVAISSSLNAFGIRSCFVGYPNLQATNRAGPGLNPGS